MKTRLLVRAVHDDERVSTRIRRSVAGPGMSRSEPDPEPCATGWRPGLETVLTLRATGPAERRRRPWTAAERTRIRAVWLPFSFETRRHEAFACTNVMGMPLLERRV